MKNKAKLPQRLPERIVKCSLRMRNIAAHFGALCAAMLYCTGSLCAGPFLSEAKAEALAAKHGPCAIVILDAKDCDILYLYNPAAAVAGLYPPGSSIKPFSAALIYDNKNRYGDILQYVTCNGKARVGTEGHPVYNIRKDAGGYYVRCSLAQGHGRMDMHGAIVHSCNAWFLAQVKDAPEEFCEELCRSWGLNRDFARAYRGVPSRAAAALPHLPRTAAQLSVIGEGGAVRVSPLKLAQMYASLFTGKPMIVPHEEDTIMQESPLPASSAAQNRIYAALAETVTRGTLKTLRPAGANRLQILAGKTGSATKYMQKYKTHGWCALHLKDRNGEYVLVVFLEDGNGQKAAKLAGDIIEAL